MTPIHTLVYPFIILLIIFPLTILCKVFSPFLNLKLKACNYRVNFWLGKSLTVCLFTCHLLYFNNAHNAFYFNSQNLSGIFSIIEIVCHDIQNLFLRQNGPVIWSLQSKQSFVLSSYNSEQSFMIYYLFLLC